MLKIHHLDCGTIEPVGGRFAVGAGEAGAPAGIVCHCLVVESRAGIALIDTGFGLADAERPGARLDPLFIRFARPRLRAEDTAIRQLERLGLRAADVEHVVLTHMDLDHAAGLGDFPRAQVHVYEPEHRAAMTRAGFLDKRRYLPIHWAHAPRWRIYEEGRGEPWLGFPGAQPIEGMPELSLVPLPGHSRGHCGVAIRTALGPVLHAGDAYDHRDEMAPRPRCPLGLRLFQWSVQADGPARYRTLGRLRALARERPDGLEMFCAHDAVELVRARARRAAQATA